jgi:hypothetical protein
MLWGGCASHFQFYCLQFACWPDRIMFWVYGIVICLLLRNFQAWMAVFLK